MKRAGVILCGGRSSRMGTPKALLPFAGQTMLERVADILLQVVDQLVLVAAPDQEITPPTTAKAIAIVHDDVAFQGPLSGLAVGLGALPPDCESAYVSSCDVPLLAPEWVRFLFEQLGSADIVVPIMGDRANPLASVYRPAVAATAQRLLAEGKRRPIDLYAHHPTVRLSEETLRQVDPELLSLRNVNTSEEYAELLAWWENRMP